MLVQQSQNDAVGPKHEGAMAMDAACRFELVEVAQTGGVLEGGKAEGCGVVRDVHQGLPRQSLDGRGMPAGQEIIPGEPLVGQEAINCLGLVPVGRCLRKGIEGFLSQVSEQPLQSSMEAAIRQWGGSGYSGGPDGQRKISRHPSPASQDFLPGIPSYGSVGRKRK